MDDAGGDVEAGAGDVEEQKEEANAGGGYGTALLTALDATADGEMSRHAAS